MVKVSQNGTPLGGYTVQFQGSGCNQDFPQNAGTGADGTASYVWYLAGDVGQQTLKVYAINSQNQKADSVSVTATGIAGGRGWHNSGCAVFPNQLGPQIVKLSTGKLFSFSNNIKSYLRYSTDNGASWYAVKNLGNTYNITWIVVTPADELYVFAGYEDVFYSNDAGQTWKQLPKSFNFAEITGSIYTSKGKLLVTTKSNIIISGDNGQTWKWVPPSGAIFFTSPAEDKNGNLYVVAATDGTIFQSKDEGATWKAVPKGFGDQVYGLYIDKNGWFFKTGSDWQGYGGLYVSQNGGATYQQLINYVTNIWYNFSLQSDGNYYYETPLVKVSSGIGLYRYNYKTDELKLVKTRVVGTLPFPYIVAQNGNLITFGNIGEVVYLQK